MQFYEQSETGLGSVFALEVERTVDRICAFPASGAKFSALHRGCSLTTRSSGLVVIVAQAKFSEIVDAFDFVSAAPPLANAAYLSRESGAVYWSSEDIADLDELPADVEENEKYLLIPHKNDLGLGKSLALRFAELSLADDIGKVREIFSHRGAYARFKDLLEYRGLLNRWYEFEGSAQKQALREWCRQNGVEIDG